MRLSRGSVAASIVCLGGLLGAGLASADIVAVIGTGEVGGALGPRLGGLGHQVIYGSREPGRADVQALVARSGTGAQAREPAAAAAGAEVVILAVPWNTVEEVVRSLGDLAGKIVIDPSNPRIDTPDGFRDYAFDTSNAERIQALAPGAMVVKAFNTLGADVMADPDRAGGPVTIPVAADGREAAARVAELVRALGFEPVDVGPLRYARIVEGLHFIRYNAGQLGASFDYYFRPIADSSP
jgi:predicted dinucleotide-binding enzyme